MVNKLKLRVYLSVSIIC